MSSNSVQYNSNSKLKPDLSTAEVNTADLRAVERFVENAQAEGLFPGAVICIKRGEEILLKRAFGQFFPEQHSDDNYTVSSDTAFDIGNLTTAVATVPLLLRLMQQGLIAIDDQVIRFQQSFSVNGKAAITLGDLLFHVSGLPSQQSFYEELLRDRKSKQLGLLTTPGAKQYICNQINRSTLKYKIAAEQTYTDLGPILLGQIIEQLTGRILNQHISKEIYEPLGMSSTGYISANNLRWGLSVARSTVAPGPYCNQRKRELWGEVQDELAWAMGGVSGHAGIFSTVDDLVKLSSEFITAYNSQSDSETAFFQGSSLRLLLDSNQESQGLQFVGGLEKPHQNNSLLDVGLSEQAFGFNSNTGCMLWVDPKKNLEVIFLSNANCPVTAPKKLQTFRPQLLASIISSI